MLTVLLNIYLMGYILFFILLLNSIYIDRSGYLNKLKEEDPEKAIIHAEVLEQYGLLILIISPLLWPIILINLINKK